MKVKGKKSDSVADFGTVDPNAFVASIVVNSVRISMVKGKKGELNSLEIRVEGVAPSHGKLLRSRMKATSGVEGEGSKLSRRGKGKTKKVSVAVVLDNPKSFKDLPSDIIPNLLEVSKDSIDKEERKDIIEEEEKLSKEELDLAKNVFN